MPRDHERLGAAGLGFGLALAGAAVVYEPWRSAPFEMTDFGEFLPLLRHGATFADRFTGLTRYYGSHGRFYPLALGLLDAKWTLFGSHVVLWQLANGLLMAFIVAGFAGLLARLGATLRASVLASSMAIVAYPVVPLWLKLHLGDQVGLLCVLIAAWLVTLPHRHHPWRRAIGVTTALGAAVLLKETFIAAAPFVVLLAAGRGDDGRWRKPALDATVRTLGATLLLGLGAVAGTILEARLHAPVTAYATHYGLKSLTPSHVGAVLSSMLLPSAPRPFAVGNVLFAAIVIRGWYLLAARCQNRSGVATAAATALALPLAGAIIYAPWSIVGGYYAGAFLLGDVLLLGAALAAIEWFASPRERWAAWSATVLLLSLDGAAARRSALTFRAQREVDAGLVTALADVARGRTVVAATPEWNGIYEGRMAAYGGAVTDAAFPIIREQSCEAAHAAARARSEPVFAYAGVCQPPWTDAPTPTRTVRRSFQYLSFSHRRFEPDSVRADLWAP